MFWRKQDKQEAPKIALMLSGGGARAAYQVGVLKALADILPKHSPNPFPIICGTSAGAINASAIAIYAPQFREAVWRLVHVWGNFHVHQVFRSDLTGLTSSALHWVAALAMGGLGKYNPVSLLDRKPLRELLKHYLPFEKIQDSVNSGYVEALCITASNYSTGNSVSFFQGQESLQPWERTNRIGVRTAAIGLDHLMASSAIPFVFAAERIDNHFYGDGTMRQNAPTSPAIHLGADKLFIIGNKHDAQDHLDKQVNRHPSMGQVAGHVLDSIFLDNVSVDVERLQSINRNISQIPDKHLPENSTTLRKVEIIYISPSRDLYSIAQKHYNLMPGPVRLFLHGLGTSKNRSSNLISYLLFEKEYCRELIALGYGDTMERKEEVKAFMSIE